jgi:6-phosphogluconolactonase
LAVEDRLVAVTDPYQGRRRMTLTYPVLEHVPNVLWLVTGGDKTEALGRLRAGDPAIPASRISTANALLIADQAAAGLAR